MQRIAYLITFLAVTPLAILISSLSLLYLTKPLPEPQVLGSQTIFESPQFGVQVYAALPTQTPTVAAAATPADARIDIIRQYLDKYHSSLTPFSELIISVSDQYNLDYRLLVAIAQQESNVCKKIPDGTFNCWGWGIHSQGTLGFPDYPTAITTVARGLREDYLDKGYTTPEEIMKKYTPASNGSWAAGVNQFMAEME
ncbi:hypothetical protein HY404_03320 [Candidatus Microgenomates bacterium]|nr:hypothetical protein [Candidatus Microgenomates bacterium]